MSLKYEFGDYRIGELLFGFDKRLENIENLLSASCVQNGLSTNVKLKIPAKFDETEYRKNITEALIELCLGNIETRNLKYLNRIVAENVADINRIVEEKHGIKNFYSVKDANVILDDYGLLYDPSKR